MVTDPDGVRRDSLLGRLHLAFGDRTAGVLDETPSAYYVNGVRISDQMLTSWLNRQWVQMHLRGRGRVLKLTVYGVKALRLEDGDA